MPSHGFPASARTIRFHRELHPLSPPISHNYQCPSVCTGTEPICVHSHRTAAVHHTLIKVLRNPFIIGGKTKDWLLYITHICIAVLSRQRYTFKHSCSKVYMEAAGKGQNTAPNIPRQVFSRSIQSARQNYKMPCVYHDSTGIMSASRGNYRSSIRSVQLTFLQHPSTNKAADLLHGCCAYHFDAAPLSRPSISTSNLHLHANFQHHCLMGASVQTNALVCSHFSKDLTPFS